MSQKTYNEIYSKNDAEPVSVKLQRGLNKVANAVKSTLGPAGNTVLIDRKYLGTATTKDGVTVAKSIVLKDDVENIAATMIKQVAAKAVDEAGDGTTTATILAQAIYNEGLKVLPYVKNRNDLKRSIEKYAKEVVERIKNSSMQITFDKNSDNIELYNIAKISSNGDSDMARAIVDAFKLVGKEGIISVDDGVVEGYVVDRVDGLKVDAGIAHPYFISDVRKLECEQNKPYVLLVKDGLDSFQPIIPVLEMVGQQGKSITIFSDNFSEQVIELALANRMKAKLDICLVKIQGYGANKDGIFEDVSALTGSTPIDKMTTPDDLLKCVGHADKIIANKNETNIIASDKDELKFNEHIEMLKTKLETEVNKSNKDKIEDRISKLLGGVATIKVSKATAEEVHEAKDRLDDAINAVRAALEEGFVAGAGSVFYRLSYELYDDGFNTDGYRVMTEALRAPLKTLCENSGVSYDYVKQIPE
ncbi:chaperonin GroEL, partial [bacterium]|nr:chaperonin GroEL [bacterium]